MKFSEYNVIYELDEKFVLLNTLTGSIFFIDDDVKNAIEKKQIALLSEETVNLYKQIGIIIEDSFNEYAFYKYMSNKEKFKNNVLSLTILMTRNCNFTCTYCFEGLNKKSCNLSIDVKNSIFKFIENMFEINKDLKILSITLFGGEPLLEFQKNYPWLKEIKELCLEYKKAFETMVITNGSLINDKILAQLKELNCSNIQITLDGVENIHNSRRMFKNGKSSFREVVKGIKIVNDYKNFPKPIIRINIDKTNLRKTYELLEFLNQEELNDCYIDFGIVKVDKKDILANFCFVDDELGDVLEPLWLKLKELNFRHGYKPRRIFNYCGLSKENFFTIDVNGDVYKCWEFVGNKKYIVGHIDKTGNMNNITAHYYDCLSRDADSISDCKKCAYLPLCGCG